MINILGNAIGDFGSYSGGGTPSYTLTSLAVKYNSTDYSYPSSFGWSDLSTVRAGSRMIEGCTICENSYESNVNYNTGLAYDVSTDRFISKNYGPETMEFFTRANIKAACAASIGTIPSVTHVVNGVGNQGVAYDPINEIVFEYLGAAGSTYIREYDLSGNVLDEVDTDLGGDFIPGTFWYDYISETMYFTTGGVTGPPVKALKKNAGGTLWETVETKWFTTKEGIGGIPNKMLANMLSSASAGNLTLLRLQDLDGFKVRQNPTPSSFINYEEGVVIDPRDYTIWYNEDAGGHASIANGNRLLHVDHPRAYYLKYHRYPNMFSWNDCKLNGNQVEGTFYTEQVLKGNNWTTLPVVDYGSHTGQQNIDNWEVGLGDDTGSLEFRGSNTAPTTTPLPVADYHTLREYNPNGTNDGWGDTVPSDWELTPTAHRYMQARVKPTAPEHEWTPADLGSDLLLWSEQNLDGLYYDMTDSDRCVTSINYVDPYNNFTNSSASQKPTWNSAGSYVDMVSASRHYQLSSGAITNLLTESEVEVHGVARKNAASSRVIFLGVTQLGSGNNQINLQHLGSGSAPANFLSIQYIDGSGTSNLYGVTDTSTTAWRMVTFRLGGSSNKIYINNVEQTLTVNTGSNTGSCFDDISATTDQMCIGRTRGSASIAAAQHQRALIITKHLSDANRALLMDYLQRIDMID